MSIEAVKINGSILVPAMCSLVWPWKIKKKKRNHKTSRKNNSYGSMLPSFFLCTWKIPYSLSHRSAWKMHTKANFNFKRICVENPFDMIDVKRTNVLLTFALLRFNVNTKAKWFGTGSIRSYTFWLNKSNDHVGDFIWWNRIKVENLLFFVFIFIFIFVSSYLRLFIWTSVTNTE